MARNERPSVLMVTVVDGRGRRVRMASLSSWLVQVAPARARGHVNIALLTDAAVRTLNRKYGRRDRVTDVLSFSYGPKPGAPGEKSLGDIVIARGVARRQARDARHSELTELRVLALHGLLHLLGYDHEADGGRMRRVETRLRHKGGLKAGLIERARDAPSAQGRT